MSWNARRKLAIFAGISECLIYAEAKYCAFEIHGEPNYYKCPRTEYCCNFGCCVSPGFQIYHLWYYWLLIIIMFLVCSGGGWWYRYWLQGRYRAAASAIPSRSSNSRTHNTPRGPTCQAQQARITYNSARNTVLLHRMWKGPHRSATLPAYNGAAASSTHIQNTSVVLNDTNCPYYQLYGPPPSYETVIAQTRNKISSPTSPEHLRSNLQTATAQNQNVIQCFSHPYSSFARMNGSIESNQVQNGSTNSRRIESYDSLRYPQFVEQYSSNGTTRQKLCMPLEYREESAIGNTSRIHRSSFLKKLTTSKVDKDMLVAKNMPRSNNSSPETVAILNVGCENSLGERDFREIYTGNQSLCEVSNNELDAERATSSEQSAKQVQQLVTQDGFGSSCSFVSGLKTELDDRSNPQLEMTSSRVSTYRCSPIESLERSDNYQDHRLRNGSLKLSKSIDRKDLSVRYCDGQKYEQVIIKDECSGEQSPVNDSILESQEQISNSKQAVSPRDITYTIEHTECTVQSGTSPSQSNPSNNVILAPSTSNVNNFLLPINIIENDQHCPLLSTAQRCTNSSVENKQKLDRSRSLD